ncbi:MAG: FG-GAP repeat protein [Thermoanaerobaculia bacterium]
MSFRERLLRVPCMNSSAAGSRRNRTATFFYALYAAVGLTILFADPPLKAATSVGLSSVRSQLTLSYPLPTGIPDAGDALGVVVATGDFNGDGISDLATGMPYNAIPFGSGTVSAAGSVFVHLGTREDGLAATGGWILLSQATGVDIPVENEFFGYALAAGDFNHDGFDDLAVGIPHDVENGIQKGGVEVYFGSGSPAVFGPGILRSIGGVENDLFGASLAVGNFDDDPYEDLAVGILGRDAYAGAVFVMYGRATGLDEGGQFLQQSNPDIEDVGEPNDAFGWAVTTGDFNGDHYDDLVVGVPQENGSGAAQIFFGSEIGLDLVHDILWTQSNIARTSEAGDDFGASLATGDFDGDGYDDLVIGSWGEDVGISEQILNAGQVAAVFGDAGGFDLSRTQAWGEGGFIGLDVAESNDEFGYSFATGDFDGDGTDDLVISHPVETLVTQGDGEATVLLGSHDGFQQSRSRLFSAGRQGIPGSTSIPGAFGFALASGDFDGDGFDDVAVGLPNYGATHTGGEVIVYGSLFSDGFNSGNSAYWSSVAP